MPLNKQTTNKILDELCSLSLELADSIELNNLGPVDRSDKSKSDKETPEILNSALLNFLLSIDLKTCALNISTDTANQNTEISDPEKQPTDPITEQILIRLKTAIQNQLQQITPQQLEELEQSLFSNQQ